MYIYMECPQLDSCLKSINDAYIYIHISIYYMLNSGFLRPQKMDGSPFSLLKWIHLRGPFAIFRHSHQFANWASLRHIQLVHFNNEKDSFTNKDELIWSKPIITIFWGIDKPPLANYFKLPRVARFWPITIIYESEKLDGYACKQNQHQHVLVKVP